MAASGDAATTTRSYEFDPAHSRAHFSVRHLMISNVRGEFRNVSGRVAYNPDDPGKTTIEADIDAASIDTREPQRDTHLKSADFLDVEHHPKLHFRSTRVERKGANEFALTGQLTIRGATREVVLEVETTPEMKDPWGAFRVGATATTRINRKDFGLNWNQALETGGVLVGDEVRITLDVELVRKE